MHGPPSSGLSFVRLRGYRLLPTDEHFWRQNCHKSGEEIAREHDRDGGNVRRDIRRAKEMYPHLDWRDDPRSRIASEAHQRPYKAVKARTGVRIPVKVEVVAGDFHVPYHDHAAVGCLLGYLADTQPDGFTINGDFWDAYQISSFCKDASRELQMQSDLDEANDLLDAIDAVLPDDCEKRFVIGNHEVRLQRYISEHAKAFYGLRSLTIDSLLRLSERGYHIVEMVGRDASFHIGKVEVGHFNVARKDAGASAKLLLSERGNSVVQGHTHRLAAIYKRNRGTGEQTAAWEGGCLCDLSPEYVTSPNWQAGFVTITRCEGSSRYHVALHEIIGGELLAGGRRY